MNRNGRKKRRATGRKENVYHDPINTRTVLCHRIEQSVVVSCDIQVINQWLVRSTYLYFSEAFFTAHIGRWRI